MFFKDEWPDRNLKKTIAGVVAITLVVGLGGYKLLTTATPVSRATALQRFRAEVAGRDDGSAGGRDSNQAAARGKGSPDRDRPKKERAAAGEGSAPSETNEASSTDETVAAAPAEQAPASRRSERKQGRPEAGFTPGRPEEGVYSWATEGYESFSGSRRQFPSETQRIVTHQGPNEWTLHHYFSEERESWSGVVSDEQGYLIPWQRNKIIFGPVTRDVTLRFDPPLRTGYYPARVGQTWEGSWDGPTSGDYRMRVFDHTTMTIGGTEVEVWALEMHMTLRGENEGTVLGRFWVDPKRHMVVREHYRQEVQSGPGTYRAEWDMTIKSLVPRR